MRNILLRTERLRQGWNQRQLADFAEISLSTVERAERGEPIRIDCIQRLCACLSKKPEQLGLLKLAYGEEASEDEAVGEQDRNTEGYDDMNRREVMRKIGEAVGATSVFLMMPETLLNSDDLERLTRTLTKPPHVDIETITGLQKTVENYWRLRIQGSIGSPDLLDAAIGHFRVVINLLRQSHMPTNRTRLCAVASETAQLAGRLLVDMRDHDTAQSFYKNSLIVAQQSNNDALYASGLGRMATVVSTLGKPQDAGSLLETAQQAVTNTSAFTLCAWLAAEMAETQAEIGNQDACWKAKEQASYFADQIQLDEYTYGESFDASRVPAYQGACHMRLRQPSLALPALQAGLNAPEVSDGLKQSIFLDITEASIQMGEIEQACSYTHQALDIIAHLHAARFVQRAYKLRQRMEPWRNVQVVKNLDERLALFRSVA